MYSALNRLLLRSWNTATGAVSIELQSLQSSIYVTPLVVVAVAVYLGFILILGFWWYLPLLIREPAGVDSGTTEDPEEEEEEDLIKSSDKEEISESERLRSTASRGEKMFEERRNEALAEAADHIIPESAFQGDDVQSELRELERAGAVATMLKTKFRDLLENSLSVPKPPDSIALIHQKRDMVADENSEVECTAARVDREICTAVEAADSSDIQDLYKKRVVSGMLSGSFRNILEQHIEEVDVIRRVDQVSSAMRWEHEKWERESNGPCTS